MNNFWVQLYAKISLYTAEPKIIQTPGMNNFGLKCI